ncbi:hypothetical protein TNCV_2410371 [Trichonephila clavipes]|nr:hypothetical protein TNCV_2410371 [Trichonephila clavipes]
MNEIVALESNTRAMGDGPHDLQPGSRARIHDRLRARDHSATFTVPPHSGETHCKTKLKLVRWFLTENRKVNIQKINLKFCFKLGKTPKETYAMLARVYEDQALPMKCVYEWFACFRQRRESISDNSPSGRLAIVRDENIEKAKSLVTKDPQLTVRMITDEL